MKTFLKPLSLLACIAGCLVLSFTALAEDPAPAAPEAKPAAAPAAKKLTATEILAKADKTVAGFDDQYMKIRLTVSGEKSGEREKLFEIYQKGTKKRLIHFLAPGDVKGMAVLVKDPTHVYAYLPRMKKVRRVATHNMSQSFAGSDFTSDDMAVASYAEAYSATLTKEDDKYYYIKGVPNPDTATDFDYLTFKVGKDPRFLIWEIGYYKGDEMVRRFTMEDPTNFDGKDAFRFKRVTMKNMRTNHESIMDIMEFKVNQGLKNKMFTERYMQWMK